MHLHALDYVLWAAAPCLQGCVLYFMHRRGLDAQLPIFYGYTIVQAVTDTYLLIVERVSYIVYFYSYWIVTALTVVLTLAIIDELFRVAFRDFAAIRSVGTSIFRWGALLILVAAMLAAFSFLNDSRFAGWVGTIVMADRGARVILCMLALLLLLGARYLRISPRSILFGVATGFVVYMLAKVGLDSLMLLHISSDRLVTRLNSVVYLSACSLWLWYAAYGEKLPQPVARHDPGDPQPNAENFLDVMERTVDKLMRNA